MVMGNIIRSVALLHNNLYYHLQIFSWTLIVLYHCRHASHFTIMLYWGLFYVVFSSKRNDQRKGKIEIGGPTELKCLCLVTESVLLLHFLHSIEKHVLSWIYFSITFLGIFEFLCGLSVVLVAWNKILKSLYSHEFTF